MHFRELVELQTEKQEHHLHLTMETLFDMRQKIEFLPLIYQERKSLATHHLIVLDVNSMQVVGKTCINSNLEIRKCLRKSPAGYAMYTITRTSDIYDQKLSFLERMKNNNQTACSQVVKYQITHQYMLQDNNDNHPAKCTVEMSEFLIHYNNQTSTKLNLIGRK